MNTFDRLMKTLVGSSEPAKEEKAELPCDPVVEIEKLKARVEDLEKRLRLQDLIKLREKRLWRMGLGRQDKK